MKVDSIDTLIREQLDVHNAVVSYRWLSLHAALHVNAAKKELEKFVSNCDDDKYIPLYAVYTEQFSEVTNAKHYKISLVSKEKLGELKNTDGYICSHVYSVQKKVDIGLLYDLSVKLRTHPDVLKYSAIKYSGAECQTKSNGTVTPPITDKTKPAKFTDIREKTPPEPATKPKPKIGATKPATLLSHVKKTTKEAKVPASSAPVISPKKLNEDGVKKFFTSYNKTSTGSKTTSATADSNKPSKPDTNASSKVVAEDSDKMKKKRDEEEESSEDVKKKKKDEKEESNEEVGKKKDKKGVEKKKDGKEESNDEQNEESNKEVRKKKDTKEVKKKKKDEKEESNDEENEESNDEERESGDEMETDAGPSTLPKRRAAQPKRTVNKKSFQKIVSDDQSDLFSTGMSSPETSPRRSPRKHAASESPLPKKKAVKQSKKRKDAGSKEEKEDQAPPSKRSRKQVIPSPDAETPSDRENDDDVIPPTPPDTAPLGKRTYTKSQLVAKTFTDEEGYLVTKKVQEKKEFVEEAPKQSSNSKTGLKNKRASPTKQKKEASSGPKTQATLSSFFKKT